MVPGDRDSGEVRLKREECSRTKPDREFSKWEILVGAFDWEDYSLGKEGAERYRVHNLPNNSGPGVYELGVAVSRTGLGRNIDKIDPDRIVVVYLGQADNVRTRLQHYGRSGSHLGNSASIGIPKEVGLQKGPGLFEDILSRGYPIVFRWAGMQSKTEALRTETRLLNTFDYAWNASTNGPRRPDDVLRKLNKVSSSTLKFADIAQKLITPFGPSQVGIRIKSRESTPQIEEESHNFISRVFKFGRSRPRLLDQEKLCDAVQGNALSVCGVILDGQDSICTRPPVEGKKRCSEHKGMRVKASVLDTVPQPGWAGQLSSHGSSGSFDAMCGFVLADGSPCKQNPVQGNKRCVKHKGRSVCGPNLTTGSERPNKGKCESMVCGVILGDGLLCGERPVAGRVRCEVHKGMRVKASVLDTVPQPGLAGQLSSHGSSGSFAAMCGVVLADGSPCKQNPVQGNKRCVKHKGRPVCGPNLTTGSERPNKGKCESMVCGVILGDGLHCTKRPVAGRVRCEEHKGMRIKRLVS